MVNLILSPEATVRFKHGKLVIEGPKPGNHLVTDNAFIVFLLKEYSLPKAFDDTAVPQKPEDRAQFETVRALRDRGVLIPARDYPDFDKDPATASRQEETRVQERLSEMADVLYRLSGDFAGLASYCHRHYAEEGQALPSETVGRMALVLRDLQRELAAMRDPFLKGQLESLSLPEPQRNLKIHIGAGPFRLPSWINIDIDQGDLMMNLTWGLPFADASADFVFFSHTLEHLYYPGEALKVLRDVHRVLVPGGTVRVIVPEVGQSTMHGARMHGRHVVEEPARVDGALGPGRQPHAVGTQMGLVAEDEEGEIARDGAGDDAGVLVEGHGPVRLGAAELGQGGRRHRPPVPSVEDGVGPVGGGELPEVGQVLGPEPARIDVERRRPQRAPGHEVHVFGAAVDGVKAGVSWVDIARHTGRYLAALHPAGSPPVSRKTS